MPSPSSHVAIYMHVCPKSYSNQFTYEPRWTFVPDVKEFSQAQVTVNLTFDQQNLICSSGHLCQIWRHPLKVILGCSIHKRSQWPWPLTTKSPGGCLCQIWRNSFTNNERDLVSITVTNRWTIPLYSTTAWHRCISTETYLKDKALIQYQM